MPNPNSREVTPQSLAVAFKKYRWLFGVPPHGTRKQITALLELVPKPKWKRCGHKWTEDCDCD